MSPLVVETRASHSSLDRSWGNPIRARRAIALFEFFAGAEGFEVDDAVDGEDAIEVVDFVLQEFGEIAIIVGAEFLTFACQVLVTDGDRAVPLDLHEDRQEAEAGVPDNNLFFAAFDDFRVHQGPGLLSGQLQEDDASAHAELGSGDAASVTCGRAPVGKRVGEVSNESSDFGSGEILNRQRDFAQSRIAKLEYGMERHSFA
jgi:hypothetical protein